MTAPIGAPPTPPAGAVDKPTKILPTDRVRFEKQLDLLRAYAAVSGQANKVVNVDAVANVAKLNGSTISLCNGFFVDARLLERSPTGGFIPSSEVMQFQRAHAWAPDTAANKLAPPLAATWFFQRLQPKLTMGPMSRAEAVQDLADEANAHKKYESQLYLLLDYLEAAGLVRRDGDTLRLVPQDVRVSPTGVAVSVGLGSSTSSTQESRAIQAAPQGEATTVAAPTTPGVHFTIDVSVSMAEIGTWNPERIAAFFGGVAQVLAAKSGIDNASKPTT